MPVVILHEMMEGSSHGKVKGVPVYQQYLGQMSKSVSPEQWFVCTLSIPQSIRLIRQIF